jgi:hypothetical protein
MGIPIFVHTGHTFFSSESPLIKLRLFRVNLFVHTFVHTFDTEFTLCITRLLDCFAQSKIVSHSDIDDVYY